jgi:hypothetical protein
VFLAARGMRNLDGDDETIEDSATRDLLQHLARKIHIKALLAAFTLTVIVYVFLRWRD